MLDYIKRAVSQDILLAYLYLNKRFGIHMDARDYQLGEVISQEDKPIYFYSHNLTGPQTQYTVTENESLIVVETLKEFCTF